GPPLAPPAPRRPMPRPPRATRRTTAHTSSVREDARRSLPDRRARVASWVLSGAARVAQGRRARRAPATHPSAIATAEAAAAPTATASAGRALAGLAHGERAAAEGLPVQRRDRRLRLGVGGHLDEGEPTRPAGLPVGHDLHLLDLTAVLLEEGAQLSLFALIGEVAYVQSL